MSVVNRWPAWCKGLLVVLLVYVFLISINLMGGAFKLFGQGFADALIRSCSNPFSGLFIGILATTLLQSSSTTTSLVVGFVGGGALPVNYAIPIIMGANIGTTVTNILVSFTFITRRVDFKRAFAGATVHDFFNLLTVITMLPLELKFRFIERSAFMLTGVFEGMGGVKFVSPIKRMVDPVVNAFRDLLIQVFGLPDRVAAGILLGAAVLGMVISLVYLVKTMRSIIIGRSEDWLERYLFRSDFHAFVLGIFLTVAVQSSSISTALAIPLVGAGILSLQRCYPFTLGANIGTTCTALLASLATVSVSGTTVHTLGVTAAFAHLIFNICGIAIFYPLKRIPIWCAVQLSNIAARARWVAVLFVLGVFFIFPLLAIYFYR